MGGSAALCRCHSRSASSPFVYRFVIRTLDVRGGEVNRPIDRITSMRVIFISVASTLCFPSTTRRYLEDKNDFLMAYDSCRNVMATIISQLIMAFILRSIWAPILHLLLTLLAFFCLFFKSCFLVSISLSARVIVYMWLRSRKASTVSLSDSVLIIASPHWSPEDDVCNTTLLCMARFYLPSLTFIYSLQRIPSSIRFWHSFIYLLHHKL